MKNNFLQLALVSFAGLITIVVALTFIGSGSLMNNNMMPGMNGQNMSQMNMNGMSGGYMPQNMSMGNGANMRGGMNSMPAYYGHMNNYPYNSYGSMDSVNYSNMGNMGGPMNMPMGNAGMNSAPAPIIVVVPGQNQQNSNGMNGMNQMNGRMMMGM